jgi:phosphatidyl-myo-inositol dimannoside synthase
LKRWGVIVHGSEVNRFQRNPWLTYLTQRWLDGAERCVAASPHAERLFCHSGLVPAGKVVEVAPCGLREAILEQALQEEVRETTSGSLKILSVARLHPRKGQLETAKALAMLPLEWRQRVVFQLVGKGDESYLAAVRQVCEEAKVTVDYRGEMAANEIVEMYRNCDLFAQPSITWGDSVEGLGMTNLEAAIYGKAVVGYDSGGVKDAVVSEKTGLLVAEGDVSALSQAILRLLADTPLRRRMGLAGREYAASFSFQRAAKVLFGAK